MKKWFPTFLTIGLGIISVLTPDIQRLIGTHPTLAVSLATTYAVLKGVLPSPLKGDK